MLPYALAVIPIFVNPKITKKNEDYYSKKVAMIT